MTLGERIKNLRKSESLTQQLFAEKIGSTQNVLANYESGRRNPSSSVINNICKTFNVSEVWLRTGKGEMFVQREPQPLEILLEKLLGAENVTEADRVLMKNFLELSDASRQEVIAFVQRCAQDLSTAKGIPGPAATVQERTEPGVAAEMAELKRQTQDLAARMAAMEEEDAFLGLTDVSSKSPSVSVGSFSPTQAAKK